MSAEKCETVVITASFRVALEDLQRMRAQAAQLRSMSAINLQVIAGMLDDPNPQNVFLLQGIAKCFINAQILTNGIDAKVDEMTTKILAAIPHPPKENLQ